MEENWIKIMTLKKVEELVTQQYILDESMDFWREVFKQNGVEYKFKIEQITEYANGVSERRTKGQFESKYVLNLYCKNEDKEKIKNIIEEYNDMQRKTEFEKEDIEECEKPIPIKIGEYFIILVMIMLLILEVYMTLQYETNFFILIIVASIEIFMIKDIVKKKVEIKKKKRGNKNE